MACGLHLASLFMEMPCSFFFAGCKGRADVGPWWGSWITSSRSKISEALYGTTPEEARGNELQNYYINAETLASRHLSHPLCCNTPKLRWR